MIMNSIVVIIAKINLPGIPFLNVTDEDKVRKALEERMQMEKIQMSSETSNLAKDDATIIEIPDDQKLIIEDVM